MALELINLLEIIWGILLSIFYGFESLARY
jgi:hypothetical protein